MINGGTYELNFDLHNAYKRFNICAVVDTKKLKTIDTITDINELCSMIPIVVREVTQSSNGPEFDLSTETREKIDGFIHDIVSIISIKDKKFFGNFGNGKGFKYKINSVSEITLH